MKPVPPKAPKKARDKVETSESVFLAELALREAGELRRVIGDPRVRVEVPTDGPAAEHTDRLVNQRYHIG